ncbi:T-complex protein 1 subunit theta [Penicillium canariense]|uniref:T-complex protein 1 subunit theta n=1 Tax=Penicillium canariense TaxID=189055 RepID=A0A9W9I9H1_9EURO|nr:T-complex protein 1 subunit theta [Penicillium canariense]KAJ5169010.1 T-complex protein 1 subunit theta [Penicillium canariense]
MWSGQFKDCAIAERACLSPCGSAAANVDFIRDSPRQLPFLECYLSPDCTAYGALGLLTMLRQPLLALRTAHPPVSGRSHPPAHLHTLSRSVRNPPQNPLRWKPTLKFHQTPLRPHLQHSTLPYARHPFSTTHPCARNTYNRFNPSSGRASLFHTLLARSKPHHFVLIGLGLSGLYLYNTDVVEMTGRRRFNCVSHAAELKMGAQSYREVLAQSRGRVLPDDHPLAQMVDRVLRRLIPQAPIEGADWRVHVIMDDGNANAFVLPGGKVFVYTGILPICEDEDGLAAVLGHEIAHVVARHPAERMSTSILTLGTVFLISLLFDVSGQLSSMLVNLMWSLPNSRTQEAEADNIGLMMMAKACFNPEAAVKLWHRMQQREKSAPPQFMSTHPSSYNREEAIRGWLDKAETIYADSGCSTFGQYMPSFKKAYRSQSSYGW